MNNRDQFKQKMIEAAQSIPGDERVPVGLVQDVMSRVSGLEIEERSERGLSVKSVFFGSLLSFLLGCIVLGVSCLEAVRQIQVEQSKVLLEQSKALSTSTERLDFTYIDPSPTP
jgi:hypothetical protein